MAEVVKMAIDGEDESKPNGQDQPKKTLKRKRATLTPKQQQQLLNIRGEQKGAKIEELKREMKGLFRYHKETTSQKKGFGFGVDLSGNECSNVNVMVGLLMEESGTSFTKLVEEIYKKLVKMSGNLTVVVVKNAVLFVGQREMYGVPNVDADILEDETHSCLGAERFFLFHFIVCSLLRVYCLCLILLLVVNNLICVLVVDKRLQANAEICPWSVENSAHVSEKDS
ncbi:hypothetical protein Peur_017589 [Populus x canadensis]